MICMFSFLIVVSVHCQTCVIEPIKVECNFNFTYQTFALKVHSHNHLLSLKMHSTLKSTGTVRSNMIKDFFIRKGDVW